MRQQRDRAYAAYAIFAASVLVMSLMNVTPVPEGFQDIANMLGEIVRGTIFLVGPIVLVVALVYSIKLWRDRSLVFLGVCALVMVGAVIAEAALSRSAVNAIGLICGALGLALSARWFLVARRAVA
ncbi:MAG: hypothetical protein WD825_07760 [Gemmatimonadaceae bacterium]